jgi:signal transduction histidine kinase
MLDRLEEAYRQLQVALESQKRFVADASHELRTPLTTIRTNAGFLLRAGTADADERAAALRDIAGESERMSRMVRDLLTLARADAGHRLEMAPLDLAPVAADLCRQARTLYPTRYVELVCDDAVPLHGNEDALTQLLWILVDNAVKHSREGGRIRVELVSRMGRTVLHVTDDGPGIPAADLTRIFDRFFQADAARGDGGAGLGLAIARWIAEEHGGVVHAYNNQARGATFRLDLPAPGRAGVPPTFLSKS